MNVKLSQIHKITLAATLLVLNVLLTRLPGLLQAGAAFSFNRVTLGPATVIYASLLLGPFYGALVGAGGDFLGFVILGQWTGTFDFFLTIYYALLGILPWCLYQGIKRIQKIPSWTVFAASGAMFLALALLLWLGAFDGRFAAWGLDALTMKIVLSCVGFALCSAMAVGLYFTLRYFHKRSEKFDGVLSPEGTMLLCVLVEVFVIFGKPLAFYLYCLLMLGKPIDEAWHISYGTLALLSLLFAFADIPVNAFSVTWANLFTKPLLSRGNRA